MTKLRAILLVGLIALTGTLAACNSNGCGCGYCNPCGEGPSN